MVEIMPAEVGERELDCGCYLKNVWMMELDIGI
jgi:hypothetical protein